MAPNETELAKAMASHAISGDSPAAAALTYVGLKRPDFGTAGKPVQIDANHYKVDVKPVKIHRYDVKIVCNRSSKQSEAKPTIASPAPGDKGGDVAPKITNRIKEINVLVIDAIQKQHLKQQGVTIVFDMVCNAVTNKKIVHPVDGDKEFTFVDLEIVDRYGEKFEETYSVTFAYVKELNLDTVNKLSKESSATPTEEIRIAAAECFQALEWITSYGSILARLPRGRSYYSFDPKNSEKLDLGGGRQLRFGIFKSLHSTQSGICLNIDRAANVFHEPMLVTDLVRLMFFARDLSGFMLTEDQSKRLSREIRTLRIRLEYGAEHRNYRRKVRANGVTRLAANKETFVMENDKTKAKRTVTVAQFFADEYNVKLQFPNLPCVEYGTKKRLVPMELCYILENQVCNTKLTPQQQGKMVRECANNPTARAASIRTSFADTITDSSAILTAFGLSVAKEMLQIPGRVIPPPTLLYSKLSGGNRVSHRFTIQGMGGEWRALDTRDRNHSQFYSPAQIGTNWAVVMICEEGNHPPPGFDHNWVMNKFAQPLVQEATKLGLAIGKPATLNPKVGMGPTPLVLTLPRKFDNYALLKSWLMAIRMPNPNLKLLVVVMPYRQFGYPDLYNVTKYFCDVFAGLPTQCIKAENIYKEPYGGGAGGRGGRGGGGGRGGFSSPTPGAPQGPDSSYLGNVIQKVNAKGGGKNVSFEFDKKALNLTGSAAAVNAGLPPHFMIVGADVTHPAPADELTVAVAAIVASMDPDCAKWVTKIRVQTNTKANKATQEMIDKFDEVVVELVVLYAKKNGDKFPEGIIIYRDGVSEGQLAQVLTLEVDRIEAALRNKWPNKQILITCIVTQKRHHTRFFPNGKTPDGAIHQRSGNLGPGLVVDKGICKPHEYDFYLLSHIGIKGTSRPTHYEVIRDDFRLTVDFLQKVTYALCHLYTRCTRSISIPVPVAYADLAAYRGRNWIVGHQAVMGRKFDDKDITELNEKLFAKVRTADELLFYS